MYHIKNDKRAQKSAQLIANAILDLAEQKPYKSITITDIEKASTVARSTFYRLFDNTADVLTYLCDSAFAELAALHAGQSEKGIQLTYQAGAYWMQHHKLLEIIVKAGYQHIFVESFTRHYPLFLANNLLELPPVQDKDSKYAVSIAVSIFASALLTWTETGKQETIEELTAIMAKVMGQLSKLFSHAQK